MDESRSWQKSFPTSIATLGEPTLHSFYFTLTACVYMAQFTLALGSRVTLGAGHPFCEIG